MPDSWMVWKRSSVLVALLAVSVLAAPGGHAQSSLPVFPGAQGFGTTTRAAYGGPTAPVVLRVTNLKDSGAGSLRAALMDTRPRVVVFEVSGTIALESIINVVSPYLTVAGATAPSPGISIRNDAIQIRTHDVLIQHIRSRVGTANNYGADGFAAYTDSKNVVFDHLSVAWALDGSIDISSGPTDARNITISNCLLAEQLRNSGVIKDNHSRAMAIQNRAKRIAVIRNVFAHVSQRLPLMKADTATVVVNNLIYDQFQMIGTYFDDPDALNLPVYASIVGNRFVQGPSAALLGVTSLQGITVRGGIDAGSKIYRADNTFVGTAYSRYPYRNEATWGDPTVTSPPSQAPLTGLTLLGSTAVEAHVLYNVGSRPLDRDRVDTRIINQIIGRTGRYVDTPSDVGGYPSLAVNFRALTIPVSPHALSPSGSGYTNLEEWLHGFAAAVEGRGTMTKDLPPPAAPTGVRVVSD